MKRPVRWWRVALTGALIGGVVTALQRAAGDAGTVAWPEAPAVAVTAGLILLAHAGGAVSWLVMFEGRARNRDLTRAYFVGQLGKYVPGGMVQLAALYQEARRAGVSHEQVAVRLPVHALVATVLPCGFSSVVLAVVGSGLPGPARIALVVVGAASLAVLVRCDWLTRLLDAAHSRWRAIPSGDSVPPRRVVLKAAGWGSLSAVAYGGAAAVLLGPAGWREFVTAAAGYTVAFVVGFLALPIPSGVGVREAVFVGVLRSAAPVADLLATAVAFRMLQLAVEVVMAGPVLVAARRLRPVVIAQHSKDAYDPPVTPNSTDHLSR